MEVKHDKQGVLKYVSNTASEDHKISTVLNERRPTDFVPLTDLKTIDASKKVKIGEVQEFLYSLPKAWI